MASPVLDSYTDGFFFFRGFFPFSPVAEYSQLKIFFVIITRFKFKMVFKFCALSCKFYMHIVVYHMIKKNFKKHGVIVRQLSATKRIWVLMSLISFFLSLFYSVIFPLREIHLIIFFPTDLQISIFSRHLTDQAPWTVNTVYLLLCSGWDFIFSMLITLDITSFNFCSVICRMRFLLFPLPAELCFQWLTEGQVLGNYRLKALFVGILSVVLNCLFCIHNLIERCSLSGLIFFFFFVQASFRCLKYHCFH